MNPVGKLYKSEQGENPTYRKGSSDYHKLKYVRWLESHVSILLLRPHNNTIHSDGEQQCICEKVIIKPNKDCPLHKKQWRRL